MPSRRLHAIVGILVIGNLMGFETASKYLAMSHAMTGNFEQAAEELRNLKELRTRRLDVIEKREWDAAGKAIEQVEQVIEHAPAILELRERLFAGADPEKIRADFDATKPMDEISTRIALEYIDQEIPRRKRKHRSRNWAPFLWLMDLIGEDLAEKRTIRPASQPATSASVATTTQPSPSIQPAITTTSVPTSAPANE